MIVAELQIFSLHLIELEILLISKLLVSFRTHRGNDPAALPPEECGCIAEDLQQVGQALNQQQADMQGCHQFGGTVRCKIRYSFISLGIQNVATRKRWQRMSIAHCKPIFTISAASWFPILIFPIQNSTYLQNESISCWRCLWNRYSPWCSWRERGWRGARRRRPARGTRWLAGTGPAETRLWTIARKQARDDSRMLKGKDSWTCSQQLLSFVPQKEFCRGETRQSIIVPFADVYPTPPLQ